MENMTVLKELINEGLDPKVFAQIVDYCDKNLFTRYIGIGMTKLAPGKAYAELDPEILHSNLGGFLHGGVTATLADVSMGVACFTTGIMVVTANMNISYLATGEIGQKITAIGEVIRSGKTTLFTEAYLENQQGKLIAKATGTFLGKGSFFKGSNH